MTKISAAIITFNEEEKISAALQSLQEVCDEIVVVDSWSTDSTVEICRRFTNRVLQQDWRGFRDQKQSATDLTTHRWVLGLDADECLSPELQRELKDWKQRDNEKYAGLRIPRMTYFLGRWITHTTWYPDLQLRLFDKTRGKWSGGKVHESFHCDGPVGTLREHIYHYTYSDVSEYLSQLETFSELAAADSYERGQKATLAHLSCYPALTFFKNFVLRRGFLDGVPGLAVSSLSSISVFFKYLKLWELSRRKAKGAAGGSAK